MQPLRSGLLRPVLIALVAIAATACSSSAATPPPATAPAATSAASVVSSVAATSAASLAPSSPSVAPGGGTSDCAAGLTSGHQKYTLSGFEAWHFCGPATATITLGGSTVTITGGSCVTLGAQYSVSIGTQLFGSPPTSLEPDLLIVYVDATSGAGSISGVLNHKHWLFNDGTAFGAGKLSGTFSGTTLVPGTAIQGSFTCQ